MPRPSLMLLLLAACTAPAQPDPRAAPPGPAPQLLATDQVIAAAGADRIAPGDDASLTARAAALRARGAQLAAQPVAGPPLR